MAIASPPSGPDPGPGRAPGPSGSLPVAPWSLRSRLALPALTAAGIGAVALADAFNGDVDAGEIAVNSGLVAAPVLAALVGGPLGAIATKHLVTGVEHGVVGTETGPTANFYQRAGEMMAEDPRLERDMKQMAVRMAQEAHTHAGENNIPIDEARLRLERNARRRFAIGQALAGAALAVPAGMIMLDDGDAPQA